MDQGRVDEFRSNGAPSVVMDAEAEGPIFFGLAHRDAKRSPRSRRPTVSVVIPAKNEAGNLPSVLPKLPSMITEVVLVDGRSTRRDDRGGAAPAPGHPHRRAVASREGRRRGMRIRRGQRRHHRDAGRRRVGRPRRRSRPSSTPSSPGRTSRRAAARCRAAAARTSPGSAGSATGRSRRIVNLLFGCRYTDLCYGYNAFWRDCLPLLNLDSTGFEIETQINVRAARVGLEVREVPSFELSRRHGCSNLSPVRDGMRVLRTILSERLRPVHPPGPAWAALTGGLEVRTTAPRPGGRGRRDPERPVPGRLSQGGRPPAGGIEVPPRVSGARRAGGRGAPSPWAPEASIPWCRAPQTQRVVGSGPERPL